MSVPAPDALTLLKAHQYLYYVLDSPVLSDREFDELEEQVPDAPIGSDLVSSYTPEEIALAERLRKGRHG